MDKLQAISRLGEIQVRDFLNIKDYPNKIEEFIIRRHFDGIPPTDENVYNDIINMYAIAIETEVLPDIQYLEFMNHLISTLALMPFNVDIIQHIGSFQNEFENFKTDIIKQIGEEEFDPEYVLVIRGSINDFETPLKSEVVEFCETYQVPELPIFTRFPGLCDSNDTYMYLYVEPMFLSMLEIQSVINANPLLLLINKDLKNLAVNEYLNSMF